MGKGQLRILHTSDIHGTYKPLLGIDPTDFDVWTESGDWFPTYGRAFGQRIDKEKERKYQISWWKHKDLGLRFRDWLGGRPVISVPGNHDFLDLATCLKASGIEAYSVDGKAVDLFGLRWAGFREVNYIDGEWMGEEQVMRPYVEKALALDPDVLVTHAPAAGILDYNGKFGTGIRELTTALFYRPHKIRLHLAGHEHHSGGKVQRSPAIGLTSINGAGSAIIHTISL